MGLKVLGLVAFIDGLGVLLSPVLLYFFINSYVMVYGFSISSSVFVSVYRIIDILK